MSYGLNMILIDDNQGNFFPVLNLSLSDFQYESDSDDTQASGMTEFQSSVNYYNAEAGLWEPFIETF